MLDTAFHSQETLRSSIGARVLVRVPCHGRAKARFAAYRGKLAVLDRVLRKNAVIAFEGHKWRVPFAWLVLQSHPHFADELRAESRAGRAQLSAKGKGLKRTRSRRRSRTASSRPRDSQRSKVYRWEDDNLPQGTIDLSLDECERLVCVVIRGYGHTGELPEVTDGRGRRSACFDPLRSRIALPHRFRDERTVIHEVAHFLAFTIAPGEPAHGPLFARLLIDLASQYLVAPRGELEKSALRSRLSVAPRSDSP